ncbi:MAG: hypothetical protein AAFV53_24825 [Myxococcota bacterium]
MSGWLVWVSVAVALDGGDVLRLTLEGDVVVEGVFARATASEVMVNAPDVGVTAVPLVLVTAVAVNGTPMGLEAFKAEAASAWQQSMVFSPQSPGQTPHPALVASTSMLWAGSGHAALGEWKDFAVYSTVEVVLLGAMAVNLVQEDVRPLPPLIALDALFKIYAAQESARIAKRRRRAAAAVAPGGGP